MELNCQDCRRGIHSRELYTLLEEDLTLIDQMVKVHQNQYPELIIGIKVIKYRMMASVLPFIGSLTHISPSKALMEMFDLQKLPSRPIREKSTKKPRICIDGICTETVDMITVLVIKLIQLQEGLLVANDVLGTRTTKASVLPIWRLFNDIF